MNVTEEMSDNLSRAVANGGVLNRAGRKPGAGNLATRDAKRVAAMLFEDEADSFKTWLHKVAEESPARACEIYLELGKIILPRMATSSMAMMTTAPDGTQTAMGMKFRGMLGLPEPIPFPAEVSEP